MTARTEQPTIYVHLGLSRAASTFLQQEVFPKFRGIVCFPKRDYRNRVEVLSRSRGDRFLFSHEGISRKPERLEALERDFPHCRPILVLRRQDHWLASRYRYQLHKRGYCPFQVFLENFEREVERGERESPYFAPYLQRLEKRFGRRPLLLLHEELMADPTGAIRILAQGVGAQIDEDDFRPRRLNASLSDARLKALRHFDSRFGYRRQNRDPGSGLKLDKVLRDARVVVASLLTTLRASSTPEEGSRIIAPEDLHALQDRYAADWASCLEYLRQDRKLLIPPDPS